MTARMTGPALVLLVIASCTCQTEAPPKKDTGKVATAKAEAKPDPKAAPEPAGGPKFDASSPPRTAVAPSAPAPTTDATEAKVDPDDPLGRRFADPGWFRKD